MADLILAKGCTAIAPRLHSKCAKRVRSTGTKAAQHRHQKAVQQMHQGCTENAPKGCSAQTQAKALALPGSHTFQMMASSLEEAPNSPCRMGLARKAFETHYAP
eukprot:1142362-Pelagomonas_calceolata.AAC.5